MATITLKNVPQELYERLKEAAEENRRSIDNEAIHCLEQALKPRRLSAQERIERIRKLRKGIAPIPLEPDELERMIDEGRP